MSRQQTLLVIDDDDDLAHALARLLESEGYRVRCAPDGEAGLRAAVEDPPDLILLDLIMPVKSGFDVCHEMRRIPKLRDVPILALTAFGQAIGEIHGMTGDDASAGIQGYLEKPFEPNVLLERVASAMAATRHQSPK